MAVSDEDQKLLAHIANLAGRINRHKNHRAGLITEQTVNHRYHPYNSQEDFRGGFRKGLRGGSRGGIRGGRLGTRGGQPFQTRSPVVDNVDKPKTRTDDDEPKTTLLPASEIAPSRVSKNDRHLQPINTAVFAKEKEKQIKAMEATWLRAFDVDDGGEKEMLTRYLNDEARAASLLADSASDSTSLSYEITVEGIHFLVSDNKDKLIRLPDAFNYGKVTPKTVDVAGVKFHRSKSGNLYRAGIVKKNESIRGVKKLDEPCSKFSFSGSCTKGPRCPYQHDVSRIAICRDFLMKGCEHGNDCDLSHEATAERSPLCLHFAKGYCTNEKCLYAHQKVLAGAIVCRTFAINGYCDRGLDCADRHVCECPDFSNTGKCQTKGCKLPHRERASVLRRSRPLGIENVRAEGPDVTSSEDGAVDSDDVSSAGLDLFTDDGAWEREMREQSDVICFQ